MIKVQRNHTKINILGVQVNAINMRLALETIDHWLKQKSPHYVCVTPAHLIMDAQNDPGLKELLNNSDLSTPDGMAIVWLLKLYGEKEVSRVYGPDLLLATCAAGIDQGWRHYFYGGTPEVLKALIASLKDRYPDIKISGHYSPPFRPLTSEEEMASNNKIKSARPDIVWVGIGSPRQEYWMSDNVHTLGVPVLVGVGAAFDFISAAKAQAPTFIQRAGFEWLFRLISEPKRLWRRYIRYPKFAVLALLQYLGLTVYKDPLN
jgi:N-acetylglucosaminyldiphosphoundecaprenol N-acetyl-beta-D-mannosaminyltransferase